MGKLASVLLSCALPLALLGAVVPANRYEMVGFSGVDCDGPLHVLQFALPATLAFCVGAIAGSHVRTRAYVLLLAACAALGVPLAVNVADALAHLRSNATEAGDTCGGAR